MATKKSTPEVQPEKREQPPVTDADLQHPKDPELENAKRSADNRDETTDPIVPSETREKIFVVQQEVDIRSLDHESNIRAMRQELIQSGLRPTGDGYKVRSEPHGDGASTDVIYEIEVTPAYLAEGEAKHATAEQ